MTAPVFVYPASIKHSEALKRSFQSKRGELAFQPGESEEFFSACEKPGLAIVRWEVWVIDHELSLDRSPVFPVPSVGSWTAIVPVLGSTTAVMGGDVERSPGEEWPDFVRRSVLETRRHVSEWLAATRVDGSFADFIRISFTTFTAVA